MYGRILIAVDGSDTSTHALREGLALARQSGSQACVAHVLDAVAPSGLGLVYVPAELLGAYREKARCVLDEARAQAAEAGVHCETELLELTGISEDVAQRLQRCAQDLGAELIVTGTHGRRGLARAMLGSVAKKLVRLSTCPVLLVPHNAA
ncbi:universal stress protein [Caballeronia sp. RCC_10]|uniref:universal stress protein n=1 Tax=Caballeronia sp. RCC_10 TaxID=3239227 RepID=UPI0035251540